MNRERGCLGLCLPSLGLHFGILSYAFLTMFGFAWWRVETLWRGSGAQVSSVIRCGYQWYAARDAVFGAEWVNLQPSAALRSKELIDGDLPDWAEPSAPTDPMERLRIGTLAVGWPVPWVVWKFETSSPKDLFPPFAEIDDQDTSLPNACEVLRGVRPGPVPQWEFLPGGIFVTIIPLKVLYAVALRFGMRRWHASLCRKHGQKDLNQECEPNRDAHH